MKINILFFLIGLFSSALYAESAFAQTTISLNLKSVKLEKVFSEIEKSTNYVILYKDNVPTETTVNVTAKNKNVSAVLDEVLNPLGLTYYINGKQIIVTPQNNSGKQVPVKQIKGVVVDSQNEPLIGVSVIVKGKSTGIATDLDGNFTLDNVPENAVLVFSYIGHQTAEISVAGKTEIKVILREDQTVLQETVVTGYTAQRKVDLTGAISVADMKNIEGKSTTNVLNALQGQLPGVMVNVDNAPGSAGTSIRVRGITTINNNNALVVIDGVPTSENLNSINPSDIESIQVLKDAASASIYGARAAAGVIVITTKKGKEGKLQVEFNASAGVQTVMKTFDMLNSQQWTNTMWRAAQNDNRSAQWFEDSYKFLKIVDGQVVPNAFLDGNNLVPYSNTDWQDEIYSSAWTQNYSMVVGSGNDKGSMMFSLNYTDQDGIMDHTYYKRYSARLNSTYNISKYFRVGENIMVAKWQDLGAGSQDDRGIPFTAMRQNPSIPVRDLNGNFTDAKSLVGSDIANPVHQLYNARDNQNESWRILGNAFLEFMPISNLTFKTNFGLEHIQYYNNVLNRKLVDTDVNSVSSAFGQGDTWTWTNTAVYNLKIKKHKLDLLAGTEAIKYQYSGLSAFRQDYAFEDKNYMIIDAGGKNVIDNGGGKSSWSIFSLFAKADYNYADKYLFSATIRRDGSSRFGENNRYGTFPSFSGGWRLTEESFMPKIPTVDYIKLRGGWGQNGNSGSQSYRMFSFYVEDKGNGAYPLNGTGSSVTPGIKLGAKGNPDLKWETTTQTNLGIDLAMLDNTLNVSFDYFWKNTKDMITEPPVLSVEGENATMLMNTGDMRNHGFEFIATYNSKQYNDFSWNATFNIAKYKNKLVKLNTGTDHTGNEQRLMAGKPVNVFYGYVADGIFKTKDEALNHAKYEEGAPGVGRIKYRDLDNNGIIDDKDRCVIGDPNPDLSMGLNLNFMYKNFTLSFLLTSELGFDIWNSAKGQLEFATYGDKYTNRGKDILKAWSPENPHSSIPALTFSDNNNETRMSTYFIEDGSYLKMKNLKLGYDFKGQWLRTLGLSSFNLYGQIDNVFTITDYSGLDPELPYGGLDRAPYPRGRTLTLGVNLKF
ncbi:MAG: TonB-dependent receptor [Dysgonomonas sp.]